MGTLLDDNLWQMLCRNTFMIDLEYVGTSSKLETCYIWEIGVVHWVTGDTFAVAIRPDIRPLPPPFSPEFVTLTDEILTERQAVDFHTAWDMLTQWVGARLWQHCNALFVAHNAFKADKPMLEIDTRRHGIKMSYNWYFLDSLIYCRRNMEKQPSYALNDIYQTLMREDVPNAHYALSDAVALRTILLQINAFDLSGPIYPSHSTSLQAIKWLGPSSENTLFRQNIRSVEQLVSTLLTSYSATCVSGRSDTVLHFVTQYLSTIVGLKIGNAQTIALSIVNRWLPG
jgi:DNA polymerase III epsilon subunit-like protein